MFGQKRCTSLLPNWGLLIKFEPKKIARAAGKAYLGFIAIGIVRHVLPYLFSLLVVWMIIAFWPPLSTFLLSFGDAG